MKFLRDTYRNFSSRDDRWVFLESESNLDMEAEDLIEEAPEEDILHNFSLKNIKELNETLKSADGREWMRQPRNMRRYQNLVEHHLLLAEKKGAINKAYPPRILYAIQASPALKKFLLPMQFKRLEQFFDEEYKEVKKFMEGETDDWSPAQTVKVCAFYEYYKGNEPTKKDKEFSKDISKRLMQKCVTMVQRYEDPNFKKDFSVQEKLLILELYRIKRHETDFIVSDLMQKLDFFHALTQEMSNQIFEPNNNREVVLYWETIEELNRMLSEEFDSNLLGDDEVEKKRRLRNKIRRLNASRFLLWADGQSEISPGQFKLLKKLSTFSPENYEDDKFEPGEDHPSSIAKQKKAEFDKWNGIFKDLNTSKAEGIINNWQTLVDNPEIGDEIKKRLKEEKEKYEAVQAHKTAAKTALKDYIEGPDFASQYGGSGGADDDLVKDVRQATKGFFDNETKDDSDNKILGSVNEAARNYLQTHTEAEEKQRANNLRNTFEHQQPFSRYRHSYESLHKTAKELIDKSHAYVKDDKDSNLNKKLETAKKEYTKAKAASEKLQNGLAAEQTFIDHYLKDPPAKAQSIFDEYKTKQTTRARQHQILSSDMAIYYADENHARDTLGSEQWEAIDDFRGAFENVFANQIADIDFSRDFNEEAFLAEVTEKIGNRRLYELLRNDFQTHFGIPSDSIEAPQFADEIINGLVAAYRDQVSQKAAIELIDEALDGAPNMTEEQRERFLLKVQEQHRLHLAIREKQEVEQFTAWQNDYRQDISHENQILETEYDEIDQVVKNSLGDILDAENGDVWNTIAYSKADLLDVIHAHLREQYDNFQTDFNAESFRQVFVPYLNPDLTPQQQQSVLNKLVMRRKVFDIFYEHQRQLQQGYRIDDIQNPGQKIYIPGTNQLRTIELQTADTQADLRDTLSKFEKLIEGFQLELTKIDSDDKAYPTAEHKRIAYEDVRDDFQRKFRFMQEQWNHDRAKVRNQINNIQSQFKDVLRDPNAQDPDERFNQGFQQFFDQQKDAFERLDGAMQEFFGEFDFNKPFNQFDFLAKFPRHIRTFYENFDCKRGFWRRHHEAIWEKFLSQSDTWKNLDRWDFFEAEGGDEVEGFNFRKAEEKFEAERSRFNKFYHANRNAIKGIKRRVEKDLKSLNDSDFFAKYGTRKDSLRKDLDDLLGQNNQFEEYWEQFNGDKSNFWQQFEEDWKNGDISSQAEALDRLAEWNHLGDQSKKMAEQTVEFNTWLSNYDEAAKKDFLIPGTRIRNVRLKFSSLSLYNIYQIWNTFWEARKNDWKRKMDAITGDLGVELFGENSIYGKEFERMRKNSENERVNQFKDAYSEKSEFELRDLLEKSKNRDEVKALITLLNENGLISGWDDPQLWRAFMRLGCYEKFDNRDLKTKTHKEIRSKVNDAITQIWGAKVFDNWDASIQSNLKKSKDTYTDKFNEDPTQRQTLADMLKNWSRGSTDGVDAVKYLAYLERAILDGKMGFHDKFYYLIMGVTTKNESTGQYLISRDSFRYFADGKFFNLIPQMEFFDPGESTPKKDGRIVPPEDGGVERIWNFEDYLHWRNMIDDGSGSFDAGEEPIKGNVWRFIDEVVEASDKVKRRMKLTSTKVKEMDHDDAPGRFTALDVNMVQTWLTDSSDSISKLRTEGWLGLMEGANMWFKRQHDYIKAGDDGKLDPMPKNWDQKREERLKKVADRIQVAHAIVQGLKKNFYSKSGQTIYFLREEWSRTKPYNARENRTKIEDLAQSLITKNDDGQLNNYQTNEAGEQNIWDTFDKDGTNNEKESKRLHSINQMVLKDDDFFNKYFLGNNTKEGLDKVWEVLEGQFGGRGSAEIIPFPQRQSFRQAA